MKNRSSVETRKRYTLAAERFGRTHAGDDDRLIRSRDVIAMLGVSAAHFYRMCANREFPRGSSDLGEHITSWRLSVVKYYIRLVTSDEALEEGNDDDTGDDPSAAAL